MLLLLLSCELELHALSFHLLLLQALLGPLFAIGRREWVRAPIPSQALRPPSREELFLESGSLVVGLSSERRDSHEGLVLALQ